MGIRDMFAISKELDGGKGYTTRMFCPDPWGQTNILEETSTFQRT